MNVIKYSKIHHPEDMPNDPIDLACLGYPNLPIESSEQLRHALSWLDVNPWLPNVAPNIDTITMPVWKFVWGKLFRRL